MTAILVDSNVIIDIASGDPEWFAWSRRALQRAAAEAPLVINPLIYAEVSIQFSSLARLDEALPPEDFRREALPWEAAFVAGKAFVKYRRRGGARSAPFPDFYIGAHAAVAGYRLLTRDARRYRTYFPGLDLIAPPSRGA